MLTSDCGSLLCESCHTFTLHSNLLLDNIHVVAVKFLERFYCTT